jgi:oligopeptidase A
MNATNPLLSNTALPRFADIRPEHIAPALDMLLAEAEAALENAVSDSHALDYEALSATLDIPVERLNSAWAQVSHLQAVVDTPVLRQAHAYNLPRIIDFSTRMGADERLYATYKKLAASPAAASLSPARRKALGDALRDFVLGGAELRGADRERYAAIQDRLGTLSQQFGDHVLDATEAFALVVPESDLAGVPSDTLDALRLEGTNTCKLTLKAPCFVPVMQYASNRAVREALYRGYVTRASELGPAELDNSALMQEILQLRFEEAALLGYSNYAQAALSTKMAKQPTEVLAFVRDLAQRAKPYAERELTELKAFAAEHLALPDLQAWDRAFASEKLKAARYAFSSQEVKPYFTEPRVLQGLFALIETLFSVQITAALGPDVQVWHASVRHFNISRGGQLIASFYLDLYARDGKQSGAWMSDVVTRWRRPGGTLQTPVAHLVCNFAPPVGDKPALLTHDDVITLFHEFGHGLHHMLTQAEDLAVSGIAGVEHDAVELPSQFMENFCWEWQVLQNLTAHVDTGEPLPRALFDRMCAARHFQSGLNLVRQCEFALFDMRVHSEASAATQVLGVATAVQQEVQPVLSPSFARQPHSFTHVFDGGYAAGYYGYAWAEVLSSDAYAAFEEAGVLDANTGQRYLRNILEAGGTRPAMDSFKAFRGREPQLDALLRHQGLVAETA